MSFYDGVVWDQMMHDREMRETRRNNNEVKIIKERILPKEDKFIFDCAYCGCRFIVARKDCDYQESPYQNEGGYFFSCPCCYKSCKGRLYGGIE